MHIEELFELTTWIEVEIRAKNVPQKYQTLVTLLQQNTQANKPKVSFDTQKKDLIKTLREMKVLSLNSSQIDYLRTLNMYRNIGNAGADMIEDILEKNVIDIATSHQAINSMMQELNKSLQKVVQIRNGLEGTIRIEETIQDKVIIRVHFDNKASIDNITNFKDQSKAWWEISRGLAMLHDVAPEEFKVVGAKRGSLILELAVIIKVAVTTTAVILAVLKVAEKILDIKKKAQEIKILKLQNAKIALDLEKEAGVIRESEINKIIDKFITKVNKKAAGDIKNAFAKAINNLSEFIESGGEVDCTIPEIEYSEDEENEGKNKQDIKVRNNLKTNFEEIRAIENKLNQIEYKK